MAVHGLELAELDAWQREQLMADALEMFADNEEPRIGQQVMDVCDAACDRVLDRDHGEPCLAAFHRGKRVLEGGAGKRLHLRKGVAAGKMRVGAWLALIGDFLRARCGHGFVGRGKEIGLQK